jgi:hypothetical protein
MISKRKHIIIAPHADDEIIGCYDILRSTEDVIVIYNEDMTKKRKNETKRLTEFFSNVKAQLFLHQIPQHLINEDTIIHCPDPIYELHPLHRLQGNIGEQLLRYTGANVMFYSTNMNAPYIYEIDNPNEKEKILNNIYYSQKQLWKYDHKYFLFEGHCQWINKNYFIKQNKKNKKEIPNKVSSEIIVKDERVE